MKKGSTRFILIVVLAALVLRLFRIGSQSLWVDELFTIAKSIPKPGLNIWDYVQYNLQGPFHSFVIYCMHFVSTGDAWLRLPGAVAGAASVYYLYRWATVWLGASVGRWAAVLLAVHPLHVQYSQELRAYSFAVFFVTFAGFHFHRMLARESRGQNEVPLDGGIRGGNGDDGKPGSRGDQAGFVFGTALAALSNFSAAFIYAVQSVLYIVRRGFSSRRLVRWMVVSLAILVIISPWVYRIVVVIDVHKLVTPVKPGELTTEERLRGETTITPSAVPYLFYVFSVGTTLGPSTRELHVRTTLASVLKTYGLWILGVAAVFGFLIVAGLARLSRLGGGRAAQVILYIALPLVLLLALTWQNAKPFNARYMLVAFPAFVCLIAAGLEGLPGWWKKGAAALVFVALALSLGNLYFNGRYAKEDVRAAAGYVEERIAEGDCVLAPTVTEVFQHYFHGPNAVHRVSAPAGIPREVLAERLARYLKSCGAVWYVRSREWDNDPEGELLRALREMYGEPTAAAKLTGVEILRYGP